MNPRADDRLKITTAESPDAIVKDVNRENGELCKKLDAALMVYYTLRNLKVTIVCDFASEPFNKIASAQ